MGSLGKAVRGLAAVLLAAGLIGSVVSGMALLLTLLMASDKADIAGEAFVTSGRVLCLAALLFGAARLLRGRTGRDPGPGPDDLDEFDGRGRTDRDELDERGWTDRGELDERGWTDRGELDERGRTDRDALDEPARTGREEPAEPLVSPPTKP
ncbi:hypothetical protein ACTOB_006845 [Actinoplanes oblitus]|uniref:Uncharacterized protein n=1 Tax=Actinoplanes oblitus TaxID=3040509 RepID=A0ABY8WAW8_9ACTN|nr:hypothetical protein [Actinoplanes oblitus]WIM94793.1 hypothetical protein ACTOB_006845 [Actinoplanes oblitus]